MSAPATDLYVRDGSRFVLYSPAAQHVPPIPVPQPVGAGEGVDGRHYRLDAPRCPHGHFQRWAVRHCKRCR